jgi:hypothetical protein
MTILVNRQIIDASFANFRAISIAIEDRGNLHLFDYTFYMHWRQFEMIWLGLALKLSLHPVAISFESRHS